MDKIKFTITNRYANVPNGTVALTWDDWNDFSYYTLFGVTFISEHGKKIKIGGVRIAYFGQKVGREEKLLDISDQFDKLADNYFSLGTDDTYYENLNNLGGHLRSEILTRLNDIALYPDIYKKAIAEEVTKISLLRDISQSVVINQYRRIANGGARLSDYSFSYNLSQGDIKTIPLKISFDVIAEHNPPTNIQIIIGRNGVGKSHLLNEMIDGLLKKSDDEKLEGRFVFNTKIQTENFSNLICVTFSAFDEFQFHSKPINEEVKYHYIGLKNLKQIEDDKINNNVNFSDEFTSSLGLIVSSSKQRTWKDVVGQLESDPIFRNEKFQEIIEKYNAKNLKPIKEKFARLSSGHKVVLLTITKLVELLQEKSLVFFDEPETHLHPPLLSSFIRALSQLFTYRNAVCLMTTHSPIILQEVPNSCVYKLSRKGSIAKFERLKLETFGENIGVLTNDIFGLEVSDSGFYNILKEVAVENLNYEEALQSINNELGVEGKAILRSLFIDKENKNETVK